MVGQRIAQVRPLRSAHIQKAPLSEGGVVMTRWYDTPEGRKESLKFKKEYEQKNPKEYVVLSFFKILPTSARMIGAYFGTRRWVHGPVRGNPGVFETTWPKSLTKGAVAWIPSLFWQRKQAGYQKRLK